MSVQWAIAHLPTPLLNTHEFRFDGPFDEQNLLRSVETVLFPGTKIQLIREVSKYVFEAFTEEYPFPEYFVDVRFLTLSEEEPGPRKFNLPSKEMFLTTLRRLQGVRYIWGGCWPEGIPELPSLYPPQRSPSELDELTRDTLNLKGVDCSGLVRFASNGLTPHKTSVLIRYGLPVEIEGFSVDKILQALQEGDLIVWVGHIVVVLDKQNSIESTLPVGVITRDLTERLEEIMKTRAPVNDYRKESFVVRRFLTA